MAIFKKLFWHNQRVDLYFGRFVNYIHTCRGSHCGHEVDHFNRISALTSKKIWHSTQYSTYFDISWHRGIGICIYICIHTCIHVLWSKRSIWGMIHPSQHYIWKWWLTKGIKKIHINPTWVNRVMTIPRYGQLTLALTKAEYLNYSSGSKHGSLNVPIEHHPTIRYMVYNGYYKVMSNIPKMGHLTTPAISACLRDFLGIRDLSRLSSGIYSKNMVYSELRIVSQNVRTLVGCLWWDINRIHQWIFMAYSWLFRQTY